MNPNRASLNRSTIAEGSSDVSRNLDASELQTLVEKLATDRNQHYDNKYINVGLRQIK